MKVRARFEVAGTEVDEIAEGKDASDLIAQAKDRVAKHLGWKGIFLNAMSPLAFAQLAVKMYNDHHDTDYPIPQTADEFVEFGMKTGNLTMLED
jgi:nucleotide-binding universal stress UspA family protein